MARRMIEEDEVNVIILSDRGVNRDFAPVPALLAIAGLHHYLIREGLRTRVSLVLETGEAREVHHFSLLIGYGCSAINPYLAFETIDDMIREGCCRLDHKTACKNLRQGGHQGRRQGDVEDGHLHHPELPRRPGLRGPRPAQDVIDEYFTWHATRVGGIGLDVIAQEVLMRHHAAFPARPVNGHVLDARAASTSGARTASSTCSTRRRSTSCRRRCAPAATRFKEYAKLVNDQSGQLCTLRGLLEFKAATPIPIDEVEPVEAIVKRFKTGAMSYGSISKEAHETLAIAMNRIGGKSNTGEGGEDPGATSWTQRRLQELRHQAGRLRPLRRHERVPGQRRRAPDQDGPGRQARRGRPAARLKVYPWIAKVRSRRPASG
jgi:hypothetical protein